MEVKEAIEFCKSELYFDLKNFLPDYQLEYNNKMRDIIALLQRGDKFEKMWREFENKDLTYKSDSPDINDEMYYIEQKYFPKDVSQNYKESEE